jgi:hypothetical protein
VCRLRRRWRRIGEGLDLYALVDLLTGPSDSAYFRKALALIQQSPFDVTGTSDSKACPR